MGANQRDQKHQVNRAKLKLIKTLTKEVRQGTRDRGPKNTTGQSQTGNHATETKTLRQVQGQNTEARRLAETFTLPKLPTPASEMSVLLLTTYCFNHPLGVY